MQSQRKKKNGNKDRKKEWAEKQKNKEKIKD